MAGIIGAGLKNSFFIFEFYRLLFKQFCPSAAYKPLLFRESQARSSMSKIDQITSKGWPIPGIRLTPMVRAPPRQDELRENLKKFLKGFKQSEKSWHIGVCGSSAAARASAARHYSILDLVLSIGNFNKKNA